MARGHGYGGSLSCAHHGSPLPPPPRAPQAALLPPWRVPSRRRRSGAGRPGPGRTIIAGSQPGPGGGCPSQERISVFTAHCGSPMARNNERCPAQARLGWSERLVSLVSSVGPCLPEGHPSRPRSRRRPQSALEVWPGGGGSPDLSSLLSENLKRPGSSVCQIGSSDSEWIERLGEPLTNHHDNIYTADTGLSSFLARISMSIKLPVSSHMGIRSSALHGSGGGRRRPRRGRQPNSASAYYF